MTFMVRTSRREPPCPRKAANASKAESGSLSVGHLSIRSCRGRALNGAGPSMCNVFKAASPRCIRSTVHERPSAYISTRFPSSVLQRLLPCVGQFDLIGDVVTLLRARRRVHCGSRCGDIGTGSGGVLAFRRVRRSRRETKRPEDEAYSLVRVFDMEMPTIYSG